MRLYRKMLIATCVCLNIVNFQVYQVPAKPQDQQEFFPQDKIRVE